MSTIKYVTSLFKDGADKLTPIAWKPTNDDLRLLRKLLINLLQDVEIPRGTDAEGLLTTKADYKAAHASGNFYRLYKPLEAYDPLVLSDAKTNNCMQSKRELTVKLLQQSLLRAAERGTRTLMVGAVEDS